MEARAARQSDSWRGLQVHAVRKHASGYLYLADHCLSHSLTFWSQVFQKWLINVEPF
jgi:hypothetical protein